MPKAKTNVIDRGKLSFTIESRILRELGERLVKQPEVALLELVKNAYDADSTVCKIEYETGKFISVVDDGHGMTFEEFSKGWMRIGTSSKETLRTSPSFGRPITGEKGIGRFAVRFLGQRLTLVTVALDQKERKKIRLTAEFDWQKFDVKADLDALEVPYETEHADINAPTGTTLTITKLRSETKRLDLKKVRTGSVDILSPIKSLFQSFEKTVGKSRGKKDPGFSLGISQEDEAFEDVGAFVLKNYILRAILKVHQKILTINIYAKGEEKPYLKITEKYPNDLGRVLADIRFFPRREGTFRSTGIDGRKAQKWVMDNGGVAVFDRDFRVLPYGTSNDDWLMLGADSNRNYRKPRSRIAQKHFPMAPQVEADPGLNWMLRLPENQQLVGLVQVEGQRVDEGDKGLIASADREGFVGNDSFDQLQDIVRGTIEVMAYADREITLKEQQEKEKEAFSAIRRETKSAIREIKNNPNISSSDKAKIVQVLTETQQHSEEAQRSGQQREQQLEVMSLLGVVAGFMTHEFGVALEELENAHKEIIGLAARNPLLKPYIEKFSQHITNLKEFVNYSQGYILNAKNIPAQVYPAKPRLQQVKRIFGKYAEERQITIEIDAEADVMVPHVPASLYNGVALNLYTNALKAVTANNGKEQGRIAFRAWNDLRWHYLEVSDNGVGIPTILKKRIFEPLFTTTQSRHDPLGSGIGLGLTLVKRGVEAFGGRADVVEPPPDFSTCVRIRLPLK